MLSDGFALLAPASGGEKRRVIELDRDANRVETRALDWDIPMRIVGTSVGIGLGWQDGRKLKLYILAPDGKPGDVSTWGKNVRQMCDGAATNEHRFGIGWLESDNRVWFVHGPVHRLASDVIEALPAAEPASVTWCGIASAEKNVALLWRDGSRLLMNFCTAKKCTSLVVRVPLDTKDKLLGYGCLRDSCLFAARDKNGNTKLHRVTERGKTIVKTLENATADTGVSVTGVGTGAFAIAYKAKDGQMTIHRITSELGFTNTWHFNDATTTPSLAWADGRLLVTYAPDKAHVLGVR